MKQASKAVVKTGAAGFIVRTVWEAVTDNEDHNANREAEHEIRRNVEISKEKVTAREVGSMIEDRKEEIIETKAPFTNFEKAARKSVYDLIKKFPSKKN